MFSEIQKQKKSGRLSLLYNKKDDDDVDPLICVGEAPWAPANSPAGRSLKKFVSCNWALTYQETCSLN